MRTTTATAAMPTDIESVPELPHVMSFLVQDETDPAAYVYLASSDRPAKLRLHEVQTLIGQLQEHVAALTDGVGTGRPPVDRAAVWSLAQARVVLGGRYDEFARDVLLERVPSSFTEMTADTTAPIEVTAGAVADWIDGVTR